MEIQCISLALLLPLISFFCFWYHVWSNTHSLLIKRPTRKTGSALRDDHITNILSHCLSQTLSVKQLQELIFSLDSSSSSYFSTLLDFISSFQWISILPSYLLNIDLEKKKNVSPWHSGFRQVQQPGEVSSLHQSEPAQGPGQTRRCFLWFLYHTAAEGREVLPGVPGVLLRDPPSVTLWVPCLDEAQTSQSYRPDEREAMRPARQAAGGLLSHWPDVCVRSVYDGWAQTPRPSSCWDREDRETGRCC